MINHADLSGNVFIREPGWYVWLDADREPPPRRQWEARPLNPFSKKASLVLRALLEEPARAWGIREIAAETRLSIGHASDVARELVRRGYARDEEGRILLGNGIAALRDWLGAYHWSKNRLSSFVVPFEHQELSLELRSAMDAAGVRFALTMLAGADRIAPHVQHAQMHLYVPDEQAAHARDVVQRALYGERVHTGGNLHVMTPYYGDAVFQGAREVDGMPVVSSVQLFLDLAGFPLRGAEAARMLALGPLRQQLGLDARQIQELTRTLE
ncbi:MAG TPA: type IV toxin-antitoxin system AbiEi family antitoxin [Longimicrobium sp.]